MYWRADQFVLDRYPVDSDSVAMARGRPPRQLSRCRGAVAAVEIDDSLLGVGDLDTAALKHDFAMAPTASDAYREMSLVSAVGLDHPETEALLHPLRDLRCKPRRCVERKLDRRDLCRLESPTVGQRQQDRGHHVQPGAAVVLNQPHHRLEIKRSRMICCAPDHERLLRPDSNQQPSG